jgi:CHAD domain-containing protein
LLRASLIRQLAGLPLHPGWGHGARPRPGSRQALQQHDLRKQFKRLRYQLGRLEALEPDLRDRLLTLKQTQNSLGLLQDLRVWRGLLSQQTGGALRRRLPGLSCRWRDQADGAWEEWRELRGRWLDPAQGLEAWQRWLLDLEVPAG